MGWDGLGWVCMGWYRSGWVEMGCGRLGLGWGWGEALSHVRLPIRTWAARARVW